MNKIILSSDLHRMEIPLSKQHHLFTGEEQVNIVYQDLLYVLDIDLSDFNDEVRQVNIAISNKQIETNSFIYSQLNDKFFRFQSIRNTFEMIFGITEICVSVELYDKDTVYLYSDYLAVAINKKFETTMDSIHDMLADIYKKEHLLLYKNKVMNTSNKPQILNATQDKFEREIWIFKDIIKVYKENLSYFIHNPKATSKTGSRVEPFEKLRVVRDSNIRYIATHPDQLSRSYGYTGLRVNGQSFIPQKVLAIVNEYSFDTYENSVVVSFLKLLIDFINFRRDAIRQAVFKNQVNLNLRQCVPDNYILCVSIIQQFTIIIFKEYLNSLEQIINQLNDLFIQYKDVLSCSIINLYNAPKPTPIFMGVYQYRNVFSAINLWFSIGDFEIPVHNTVMQLSTADLIYEYYCLLNIYDILIDQGFIENIERRVSYEYMNNSPHYQSSHEVNTYYFCKGDIELTLYYEPVIYSNDSNTTNGISLFRTDYSYFIPDFILKKKKNGETTYAIFDAKWQNRNVLKTYEVLEKTVFRYYYSVADRTTLRPVNFLWLLQGKDDYNKEFTYYQRSGVVSRTQTKQFKNSSGIVRLTPNSGNVELARIIETFIES